MFDWARAQMEEGGSPMLEEWLPKPAHPGILNESLAFNFACHLPSPSFAYGLFRLLSLLQGLHQLYPSSHLQWEAEHPEAEGLQKIEFEVARVNAKDLYEILKVARILEPSTSGDPSSSKRCRYIPSATVSDPTAQEHEEGTPEQGPSIACPLPIEANILAEMPPICVTISDIQCVYCCQAEGCSEEPSTSCTTIFAYVHHAHLGTKLSCPLCLTTFFNSNALKWQGKQTHCTTFTCPN